MEEPDGRRWADFEVGDRSENTFQQLYARLPEAELYRSDAYAVYQSWLPPGPPCGGQRGRGELERGVAFVVAEQAEPAGAAAKGYTKSVAMLVYSVALLLAAWTSKPNNSLC